MGKMGVIIVSTHLSLLWLAAIKIYITDLNNRIFFTVLEAGKFKMEVVANLVSGESFFPDL